MILFASSIQFSYQNYQMNPYPTIPDTTCSYNIYTIEEKEEEQEEFVPYERQKQRGTTLRTASLEFRNIRSSLSQSLDCKNRQVVKIRRYKTLHKNNQKDQENTLEVNTSQVLLPQVIHSNKNHHKRTPEKKDPKKNKLVTLQSEMKKHKPSFFKDKTRTLTEINERRTRVLNLDALKNNVFLFEIQSKYKEEISNTHISGKELKKLMRVHKVQTSWQPEQPPRMMRTIMPSPLS